MNISEENINLFEAYQTASMTEEELKSFEARLVYDHSFEEEFALFMQVEKEIEAHFRNKLKLKLQEADNQIDSRPNKKSSKTKYLKWSVSVAAAFVLGFFAIQQFTDTDYKSLALQNWPSDEGLPVKMNTKGKYDDAMNAFKLEQWDKAEKNLLHIDSDTSNYYLGLIYYEKKEYENSKKYLKHIPESSVYSDEARFRLSLIYLILEDQKNAIILLEKVAKSNSHFSGEANSILNEIK